MDSGGMDATGDATEGGMCAAPYPEAGTTCEVCAWQSCCSQQDACLAEPADDAGVTDCLDILGCVNTCIANPPDGGTPDPIGCKNLCEGSLDGGVDGGTTTGHTQQGVTDFDALFQCTLQNCISACNTSQEAGTQDAATE
jgi:hypothetical protein